MTELEISIKGFNHGYILSEENPKFLKELLNAIPDFESPYKKGLQAGMRAQQKKDRGKGFGMGRM
jgi:hypothetical protein